MGNRFTAQHISTTNLRADGFSSVNKQVAPDDPWWLSGLQACLALIAPFVLACLLLVVGLAIHLGLGGPKRLGAQVVSATSVAVMHPQPERVSPADTNVLFIDPPMSAYRSGEAGQAAVWVQGLRFQSSAGAAWTLVRSAWPLWLLSAAGWFSLRLIRRRHRRGQS